MPNEPIVPEPPGLSESERYIWPILDELNLQTDRGVAIVGAALLDEVLRRILLARFSVLRKLSKKSAEELENSLFGPMRPLSSFSAKSHLTFALGLIGQHSYDDLNRIRNIRNSFAHSVEPVEFTQPDIAAKCDALWVPVHEPFEGLLAPTTPRFQFTNAVVILADRIRDEATAAWPRKERSA